MIEIGEVQNLRTSRFADAGAYLICHEGQEVLLPNKYVPEDLRIGNDIEVFVYSDSEDRPVATTLTPHAKRNEFACLQVKDVNKAGAFLDWGLEKDLLLPYSEQKNEARPGQWLLVYVIKDPKTDRLFCSAKLRPFLSDNIDVSEGDSVEILVAGIKELGTQVIVNNKFLGLLYHNEVFEDVHKGERRTAYVKKLREDGKIDVTLKKLGLEGLEDGAKRIVDALNDAGGKLNLHDKSDPEDIQRTLQMSKKTFKRSIGILYKKGVVNLTDEGIELK